MADLPAPTGARLPRARWLDARLLLGLLLILASVAGGASLISSRDDTVPVWALTTDLGPDVALGPQDLVARRVRLDSGADRYLSAAGVPPVGRTLTRPVGHGELLPAGALAGGVADLRRVAVGVARASGLARGSVVDVYRLPASESPVSARDAAGAARLVVSGVSVSRVEESTRALGAPTVREVVLLVRGPDVAKILDAQGSGRIELVQVPQGAEAQVSSAPEPSR